MELGTGLSWGRERAELEGKPVNLAFILRSNCHLWSWAVGSDRKKASSPQWLPDAVYGRCFWQTLRVDPGLSGVLYLSDDCRMPLCPPARARGGGWRGGGLSVSSQHGWMQTMFLLYLLCIVMKWPKLTASLVNRFQNQNHFIDPWGKITFQYSCSNTSV